MNTQRLIQVLALGVIGIAPAHAASVSWTCMQGLFEDARCWSPVGVPGATDNVRIDGLPNAGGNLGANLYFRASAGTRTLAGLTIDAPAGSGATFWQEGGTLTAGAVVVGESNAGRLSLDGGKQVFGSLRLGMQTSGVGVWQMDSGRAEVGNLLAGVGGRGEVLHSGGTVVIGSSAAIAANSRYVLSGLAASTVLQGPAVGSIVNRGSFEQVGGSYSGTLVNEGLYLAEHALVGQTITGGRLVNRGVAVLLSNASFANGLSNETTMDVLPVGRTLTLDGAGFDNRGSFSMAGGTLQGAGAQRNSGYFSGHGRIAGTGSAFDNSGTLAQQGGTLVLANSQGAVNSGLWQLQALKELQLQGAAVVFDNRGRLELKDGRITGSGRVNNGSAGVVTGSGTIATAFTNLGSVSVGAGERLAVTGSFSQAGVLALDGSSASLSGGQLVNTGLVVGRGRVSNAIDNAAAGRVQAEGGVLALAGAVNNSGMMVAATGGTLLLQGALTQQGRLQLEGGTVDLAGRELLNEGVIGGWGTLRGSVIQNAGQMLFSAGSSQVHGTVDQQAGGDIVVSGTGVASFHGTVRARAGSELRVAEGSAAVFFASVSQEAGAAFTGGGTFYFEGGLSVGNSPGLGGAEGDVVFGHGNLFRAEIGGLEQGSGFDHFSSGGQLSFGGRLQLSFWGGFEGQAGQRFDLFDWASTSGQFREFDFAAAPLAEGLRWDTSRLYVDGTVSISAVPEPGSWVLMAAGGVALLLRRRRSKGR